MALVDIQAAIAEELDDVNLQLGAEHVAKASSPPRIILVPVTEQFSGPKRAGGNPASLFTRGVVIEAHVWGRTTALTEELCRRLVNAFHAVMPGSHRPLSANWQPGASGVAKNGVLCLLTVSLDLPLLRDADPVKAPPHTMTITGESIIPS